MLAEMHYNAVSLVITMDNCTQDNNNMNLTAEKGNKQSPIMIIHKVPDTIPPSPLQPAY